MNPAENYILGQTEPFRSILIQLQVIITHTISEVDLKYKYRIPFYYINGKPFCYLNQSNDYVDVGFWNGAQLSVHDDVLVCAGRKQIRSLRYTSLDAIQDEILIAVLQDAYAVRDKKFYL